MVTQSSPTIPLRADEAIYGIFHIQYARLYGTQETYQHHQYLGRGIIPRLTMGAINTTRSNIAAGEAYERSRIQWREAQFTDAWVTNQRIIIYANGQLLEFWHGAILALYPNLSTCTLTLEFRGAEPLKLVGPDVASIAVLVQYFTTGIEGLTTQPAFQHYRNTGTVYPGSQMQRKS